VTGRVCDLGIIADCCHRAGAALLVDASQSAGLLETDMYALGINMLAFSGHKYLLGPEGTGGLILHGATELEPVLFGGTGVQAEKLTQPQDMPFRFEAGTPNGPAFAGLGGALDFLSCPEYPAMRKRACALAEDFAAHCMADKKLRVLGGERSSARFLPLVSFSATNCAPQDIGKFLWEHAGIICRAGLHCAPLVHRAAAMPEGTLRISFSIFNTPAELRILKDAIDRLPF
jgi:selenocysteine lyase/cysteine desulfurase